MEKVVTEIQYRDVEVSFLSLSLSHKHTSVFVSLHTDPFSPSLIFHLSMPQVIKEVEKIEYRDVEIEVIKEVEVEKIVKEIEYRDVEVYSFSFHTHTHLCVFLIKYLSPSGHQGG